MRKFDEKIEALVRDLPDAEGARMFYERLAADDARAAQKLARDEGLLADALALAAWSPLLGTTLAQNPDYLQWLARERADTHVRTSEELGESLARFGLTHSRIEPQVLLARFRRRELLRVYLHDLRRTNSIVETTEELSNLADAVLAYALNLARQELDNRHGAPLCTDARGRKTTASFCVVALGKLGSRELNYASDIDLLFLYSDDGETSGAGERGQTTNREYFNRLAELTTRLVGQQSGEGAAYRVDLRLRPHGRDGALSCSLDEALRYYHAKAQAWELQTLIRSRAAAGTSALYARFAEEVRARVYTHAASVEEALRNVRLAKQKIDRQHADRSRGFNVKLGRGGIREIEFIAQALQLAHGAHDSWLHAPHTLISLGRLADRGLVGERERTELSDAYAFLRTLEHRLQMEHGLQTHSVPDEATRRALVARRMNFAGQDALADFNRALELHTARVRAAYERVFGEPHDEAAPDAHTTPHANAHQTTNADAATTRTQTTVIDAATSHATVTAATSDATVNAATGDATVKAATGENATGDAGTDEATTRDATGDAATGNATSDSTANESLAAEQTDAAGDANAAPLSDAHQRAAPFREPRLEVASGAHADAAATLAAAQVFAPRLIPVSGLVNLNPRETQAAAANTNASASRVARLLHDAAHDSLNSRRALSYVARVAASLDKSSANVELSEESLRALVRLCGASEFFGEMIAANPALIPALVAAGGEASGERDYRALLRREIDRESSFRAELIALRRAWAQLLVETGARDARGELSHAESNRSQTELAAASINAAYFIARRELARRYGNLAAGPRLAVLALGRLASGGMDYGSDLDLVIIYDARVPSPVSALTKDEAYTRLVELMVSALSSLTRAGYVYRVDLRLRPDGKNGALVRSDASFIEYLRARTGVWEWLAYVKLRAVGGDLELGRAAEAAARRVIHEAARACDAEELRRETRRVRERLEHERGGAGGAGRGAIDIKFGAGGMLDVYFAARYLQLRDDVRDAGADRSTRTTLARLRDAGSLDAETHLTLSEGYDTLRALDHHLRLIAGRSSRLPAAPDHAVLRDLARSVGHDSAAALTDTLRARMSAIRAAYDRITTRVD
ncbi:MAG: [glutamine synthetase] adenylyltransferase / [glutamine synthetase]-adenylyl-L-tyrosine [Pyrinomonadaceae bacterium]|nr:[glutamine synthetase] adenylyltransferase / [glutamine synthetase]-adenylyl-L-tyrosine [Pyrinomonadaceae bacterium]